MPEGKIFEGKTTNEAIEKGLKALRVSKNDVEINIIKNEEKRSFFDILAPRVVKVELKLKEKKEVIKKSQEKEKTRQEVKIDIKTLENAKEKVIEFLDKFLYNLARRKYNLQM